MKKYKKYLIIALFLSISWITLYSGLEEGLKANGQIIIYDNLHAPYDMYYYSSTYYIMFYLTCALSFILSKKIMIYIVKKTRKKIAQKKCIYIILNILKVVGLVLFVDVILSFILFSPDIIFKYIIKIFLQNILLYLFLFINVIGILLIINKFKIEKIEFIYLIVPIEFIISKKLPDIFNSLFVIHTAYSNILYTIIILTCISIYMYIGFYYQEMRKDYV